MAGVFDGHGSSGKEASNAAQENFHKYFDSNIKKIVKLNSKEEKDEFIYGAFQMVEK